MGFSSSRVSMHEGVAYHRNGGETQDILKIDRQEGEASRADVKAAPYAVGH
jgi:hypothetical protein